jgi:phosphopantetheinyl transferase
VAAVALAPVGIDIEKIRPHDHSLLRYISAEDEAAALRHLVDSADELLTLLWTLKEATAKASGRGMALTLRRSRVSAKGDNTFEVDGWKAVSYRYNHFFVGLAFKHYAQGSPPIRWYQPRRLPAAQIPADAGGIETVPANSV